MYIKVICTYWLWIQKETETERDSYSGIVFALRKEILRCETARMDLRTLCYVEQGRRRRTNAVWFPCHDGPRVVQRREDERKVGARARGRGGVPFEGESFSCAG